MSKATFFLYMVAFFVLSHSYWVLLTILTNSASHISAHLPFEAAFAYLFPKNYAHTFKHFCSSIAPTIKENFSIQYADFQSSDSNEFSFGKSFPNVVIETLSGILGMPLHEFFKKLFIFQASQNRFYCSEHSFK